MRKLLHHPLTRKTRRALKIGVVTVAVILAAALVTTVTVDLGPPLRLRAEQEATKFLQRPMRIGRLSVHLWRGSYVVEDLVIDGLTPESRPFLTAKRITVSMPWSTVFSRRVVFDAIEMTDWGMYVETFPASPEFPNGRHNFPRFTRGGPRGPSRWTTTLEYVRAHRGEFTYEDHGTPWSTIARNLEVVVARPASEYRGSASFSNGTVAIQNYVPMRADMSTTFKIDGGKVLLDRIDLTTDGAKSAVTGVVDLGRWPEQIYNVTSQVHFPRMREIFFAKERFSLVGDGEFTGTFHLFKGGRELKGTFHSPLAGVNDYRFQELRGSVLWVPDRLEVTDAAAGFYGGDAQFAYSMAPLGKPGVRSTSVFDATYDHIDLTAFTSFLELEGLRLAGRATGRNVLEWPTGRFADVRGQGEMLVDPPEGAILMTRDIPPETSEAEKRRAADTTPFSNHTPIEPVPIGGELIYTLEPDWLELGPSVVATPSTFIEFEGRTEYGERSRIPFQVTSGDWQESDRLLAGLLTAFGSPTRAFPIGGYGRFEGRDAQQLPPPAHRRHVPGRADARVGRRVGKCARQDGHRERLR